MYKVQNIKTTLEEIERMARSPEHAEMRRRVFEDMDRATQTQLALKSQK